MSKLAVGIGAVAIISAGGYYGITTHTTSKIKENVDSAITEFENKSNSEISYENIKVNIFNKKTTIENVDFLASDGTKGRIDSVELNGLISSTSIPDKVSVYFDNIRLDDQTHFEDLKTEFPFVDDFVMDFGLKYEFNEKKGTHSTSINGGLEDLFSFSGDLNLGNIADVWNEMKLAAKEERDINIKSTNPEAITLDSLSFTAIDNGLLDGMLEKDAKKKGITVEELRSIGIKGLQNDKSVPDSIKPEIAKYLSGNASKITVTVKPNGALTIASLPLLVMHPDKEALIDRFNITLKSSN